MSDGDEAKKDAGAIRVLAASASRHARGRLQRPQYTRSCAVVPTRCTRARERGGDGGRRKSRELSSSVSHAAGQATIQGESFFRDARLDDQADYRRMRLIAWPGYALPGTRF